MASIEQTPGELNISRLIRGDDFAFSVSFDGDSTADTFSAKVKNGNLGDITIAVTKSYSETTLKTTLVFTITSLQSASFQMSILPWYCMQASGGAIRTLLQGTIGVYDR